MDQSTKNNRTANKPLVRFHTLCTKLGYGKEKKKEILAPYGVVSSLDLTPDQLDTLCRDLSAKKSKKDQQINQLRKNTIGAIGGWLRATNQTENAAIIKGIACRAAGGYNDFNAIPEKRLRSIYSEFLRKQNEAKRINALSKRCIVLQISEQNTIIN